MKPDRFARLSQQMATLTLLFAIAMLLLNGACWLYPHFGFSDGNASLEFALMSQLPPSLNIDVQRLPVWQQAGGLVLSTVPLLALAVGLLHLRALFQTYGSGKYFSAAAARHLRKVSQSIALWVVLNLISQPLLSVWLTLHAPIGQRTLTLGVGSADITALFLAACVAIIAHILGQVSAMNAEYRQFI